MRAGSPDLRTAGRDPARRPPTARRVQVAHRDVVAPVHEPLSDERTSLQPGLFPLGEDESDVFGLDEVDELEVDQEPADLAELCF